MSMHDVNDSEMERLLEEHYASGATGAPPTPDLWGRLESRLGEQDTKPLWATLRDIATPVDGFRFAPALAASAAVMAVAVAGSTAWFAVNSGGAGGTGILYSEPAGTDGGSGPESALSIPDVAGLALPTAPAALPTATPAPAAMTNPAPAFTPTAMPYATDGGANSAQERTLSQPDATTFQNYQPQDFVQASEENVSTFSLDVDRTSFQLALNWVREGHRVEPASVRAEEWVNAFDYDYAPPADGDRFAITSDLIGHPLESGMHLARVAFKAPEAVVDHPLNVTLVLDASGSMEEGNRVAIARAAADAIRRSLDADDRISVVHFSTDVLNQYTVSFASPADRAVSDSIAQLAPRDSTNVQAGLDFGVELANELRHERPGALNYVILLSDGVANVDATDPFAILETASVPDGANPLRLVTVGVGIENYNDHLLEQLAQHGNGWYRYLFDEEQARATFRRDNWLALASPVADQARAQVIWDASVVRAWRIIGYENRVTSAESFTQDRKEFAEVYSGAATTVFYELQLHDDFRQQGTLGQVELRWVEPGSGRGWSQSTDIGSGGRVATAHADPLLRFGAVAALTADRYSALDSDREAPSIARDLTGLLGEMDALEGELGSLAAFRDFALVFESLVRSASQGQPQPDSGYSR